MNTWITGAIADSLTDGKPRIWGGWYGRTLTVLDGDGTVQWTKSFGGGYEAIGYYAGDLRGDEVESILIGGTTGSSPCKLDAARLADGTTLWTYSDPDTNWSNNVLAAVDVNHAGAKEVFPVGQPPDEPTRAPWM